MFIVGCGRLDYDIGHGVKLPVDMQAHGLLRRPFLIRLQVLVSVFQPLQPVLDMPTSRFNICRVLDRDQVEVRVISSHGHFCGIELIEAVYIRAVGSTSYLYLRFVRGA